MKIDIASVTSPTGFRNAVLKLCAECIAVTTLPVPDMQLTLVCVGLWHTVTQSCHPLNYAEMYALIKSKQESYPTIVKVGN